MELLKIVRSKRRRQVLEEGQVERGWICNPDEIANVR
jgi:hypothetical protein